MSVQHDDQGMYEEIEVRLAALEPKDALKIRRDSWVLGVMLVGMAMTVPSILGAKGGWLTYLSAIGVVLELCALGVFTFRHARDFVPEFIDAKRKYAVELDSYFVEFEEIRKWLQSLEPKVRARRLAYIESRLESLEQRYQIAFGAADKLGFLPALIGLFLQLQAITELSVATGVVGLIVVALYGMALWIAGFRLQLQTYARLLKAAENA